MLNYKQQCQQQLWDYFANQKQALSFLTSRMHKRNTMYLQAA